ncbi:DNA polymerase III subunit gamma and tau [Corynebacterium pseudodiphtheriticum]|uniref:DNA polymerase III subunit gamma and tau n=1 Tax=Corynebacterium pseudodiphtheriticum TaxID=37637 RepID=UPI00254EA792|nr:DNA polymerase III subunit gamma and tau [Corynebacterium pseudodiphtheriticum]MDK8486479.1 DNA polymerase III subunit gamma and tau [Corynebacterium pseudodiphtheriticum]MDK8493374.1 DNA polymerase III subunit gamma and tau [Corynebacterium pseudodiphtheriticum]
MALYRKYRPASFAEVIGQSQVTEPLSVALDAHRINHAYLFSGPRGCGKTSSARILARSLNCVEGPTSTPCGKCDSCRALAPGGPGNLDVTELDAASHNGVEDMRELRDRGHYAPAESRYRIFIIDEAHMISQQGFNALLKIVEEPPEHLIFIFATTEPEKVIGTIRSRTHNYPFRLLTPPDMKALLQHVVEEENVQVEDAVYPLVMQAGGGSPRDTLSLLDQLLAGAKDGLLTYQQAAPLLGVTDLALIDRVVAALADDEKGELFRIVNDVINAGHEPRRFVEDLLDRLRDLLIIQAVPEAFTEGLVSAPQDRVAVLQEQAGWFSPEALTHYADVVNERLPQMRGATSPQLLLEILCAHLLARPYVAAAGNAAGAGAGAGVPQPGQAGQSGVDQGGAGQVSAGQGAVGQVNRQPSGQGGPRGAAAALAAVAAMGSAKPQTKSMPSHGPAPKPKPGEQAGGQAQQTQRAQQPEHNQQTQNIVQAQQAAEIAPEKPQAPGAGEHKEVPKNKQESTVAAGNVQRTEESAEAPQADLRQSEQPQQQQPREEQPRREQPREEQQHEERPHEEQPHDERISAEQPSEDALDIIRSQWTKIRSKVGQTNRVAEVMLTEAKVLGIDGDTVVLGHNTGALAERINSERNNAVIVEAVSAVVDRIVQVKCIVGTKTPPELTAQRRATPQPQRPAQQNTQPQQKDQTQPADQPQRSQQANNDSVWPEPQQPQSQQPEKQRSESQRPEKQQPGKQEPEKQSTNATGNVPANPKNQDWREVANQAKNRARERAAQSSGDTFGDGVPLPPEPAAEESAPDEPPQTQPAQSSASHTQNAQNAHGAPGSAETSSAERNNAENSNARNGGDDTGTSTRTNTDTNANTSLGERSPEEIHAAARKLLETELGARPL